MWPGTVSLFHVACMKLVVRVSIFWWRPTKVAEYLFIVIYMFECLVSSCRTSATVKPQWGKARRQNYHRTGSFADLLRLVRSLHRGSVMQASFGSITTELWKTTGKPNICSSPRGRDINILLIQHTWYIEREGETDRERQRERER